MTTRQVGGEPPRIFLYKVTFDEIPHWYWGSHKEKKFSESYLGSPVTHKWMWEFYTPHLQILEFFPYTDGGWKKAREVEDRCIKPDLNNPLCLNEHVGGSYSLETCRKGASKTLELGAGVCNRTSEQMSLDGRKGGVKSVTNATGIFSPEYYGVGGKQTFLLKVGAFSRSPEKHSSDSSKGGKNGGKKGASTLKSLLFEDPDNLHLGRHHVLTLKRLQRENGLPHSKENRRKTNGHS